jgi:large subunit ribosomal protein L1
MPKRSKKYLQSKANLDVNNKYSFTDAVELAVESAYANFDETLDIAVNLSVDPRHADQMVRGTVVLPNGLGKDVKVLVFAKGEKEKEAQDAGAEYVGNDEFIEKIKGGWFDFDKAVATPDMMSSVGKIGKLLGPRGLMPNAKLGTVTYDIEKAVQELIAGKLDFRVEKAGILHAPMGKVSFGAEKLLENITSFIERVVQLKPSASKGTYIKNIAISTTIGHGIKVDAADIKNIIKS